LLEIYLDSALVRKSNHLIVHLFQYKGLINQTIVWFENKLVVIKYYFSQT